MKVLHPLVIALGLGTAVLAPTTPTAQAEEQCGVCHPDVRVAYDLSVHAQEDVTCTSCHGGDGTSLDVEQAHRGSFRSLKKRTEIPAHCASCHADFERMRPFRLPVDQYALYQTSQHGRALARGEDRVAVCTDCHGAHEVRAPSDPQSSAYPRNLPLTCGKCHGDPELMQAFGLDPKVPEDYRSSVHGKALFEQGNLAAPNCTSCHGVHGALPPGVGNVDKVCGSCHIQTRRAFLEGPHYQAMLAAGLPECVACHSSHAIQRFGSHDIAARCTECHEDDSSQAKIGTEIETLVLRAEEDVQKASDEVDEAAKVPLHVEDHRARLEEAKTYLLETGPIVHTVSLDMVEQLTRRARGIGEEVQHDLIRADPRGTARVALAAFWFYLVMTLAILWNYKRRLDRGDE